MLHTLAFQMPGLTEWIVIGIIGILLFGKRLPEVGKSLGKGIVEFKKGLKGIDEDIEAQVNAPVTAPRVQPSLPAAEVKFDPYTGQPVKPKFDPYTGKPIEESAEQQNA